MTPFADQLLIYRQQHTHKINRMTHYIGIPAIVFGLLMLLNWVTINFATKAEFSFSWLLLAGVLVYYFLLNKRLALVSAIVLIPFTFIATLIARPVPTGFSFTLFLILFFGGWILQFAGHFFEKQRPAFMLNGSQLLIGPLFILVEIIEATNMQKYCGYY